MHSDAMACEQSGHVAAENIQELAPFDAPSLEMLYPPPYFTVIADGNLRARLCIPARDRAHVRAFVEPHASSGANSMNTFKYTVKF